MTAPAPVTRRRGPSLQTRPCANPLPCHVPFPAPVPLRRQPAAPPAPVPDAAPTEATRLCPSCGEAILHDVKDCQHCGAALDEEPPAGEQEVETGTKQGAIPGSIWIRLVGIVLAIFGVFLLFAALIVVREYLSKPADELIGKWEMVVRMSPLSSPPMGPQS